MNFTINIDCTPEEARTFLGLPDVKPMQEAMMAQIQAKMTENLKTIDMAKMMELWMPTANNTAQAFQTFMQGVMNGAQGNSTQK